MTMLKVHQLQMCHCPFPIQGKLLELMETNEGKLHLKLTKRSFVSKLIDFFFFTQCYFQNLALTTLSLTHTRTLTHLK